MLDAVLLEWDGVLADTGAARRDALLRALADEGVPSSPAVYDACCAGLDVPSAAAAALRAAGRDDPSLAQLVALRAGRAFVDRLAQGFSLAPGAADFLAVAAHRTRVAIVTQAGRAETDVALRLAGVESAVAAVLTADDVTDPPPAPAVFTRALVHLSRLRTARASHVVAVVRALPAIRAARAAGIRALTVGAPAHVAAEADGAVDSLEGVTVDVVARLAGVAGTPVRA